MKIEWIEDFLVLIKAGTFSQAAEIRHVTQPAFSRRIRQLEAWLGAELIDRQSNKLTLTPQAQTYESSLRDLLADLYAIRGRIRDDAIHGPKTILTTQHTLTVSYLPKLLRYFRKHAPEINLQIRSLDRKECIQSFDHSEADFLICNELDNQALFSDRSQVQRVELGQEALVPVCALGPDGAPMYSLEKDNRIPLIHYESDSFLGSAIAPSVLDLQRNYNLEIVCETSFTLGIRELTIEGMGISWLPKGLIEKDLLAGQLISLEEHLSAPMLIIACYKQAKMETLSNTKLWNLLQDKPPAI